MTTETSMSLDTIETDFTVFETDQVLTADQLNGVADYLDDQERLTRVALLGVGIACGLWPSIQAGSVRLSHGVGTTTDGDLLFMPGATVYDRYKPYDSSAPTYPPFYPGGTTMITAYELVLVGESDSRAQPLSGFAAAEGRALGSMAAVLYVESYLHDPDICTATDCDNRGKDWIHAVKLLLVDAGSAAALAVAPDTPDGAARSLDPVAIARPLLQGALATEADIAAVYGKACDAIFKALTAALGELYAPCKWFLQDIAPADPAPRWLKSLSAIRAAAPVRGMQYYYDFLKDLAETYNAFRDALFGDTAVCCPDLEAFPKHLVLGALDPAQRSAAGRTGFYPSPMVSERFERRARARFLARKLDTLIGTFAIPGPGQIRITPSAFEERCLEDRAIPFYYAVIDAMPVQRAWSYRLSRRGMDGYNYSYNADRYGAAGAAAAPLQSQIGAFDFFRIEGHVGRALGEVQAELDALIVGANLPIDVACLSLAVPGKTILPWWNQHLYHLQYMVRSDLAAQLDDTSKFGATFIQEAQAAAGTIVTDDDNSGVPIVGTAQTKVELMTGKAGVAKAKIMSDTYDPQSNWQDDVANVAQTAAEMSDSLGAVTKKEFVTPLDAVIAGQPARWLTWVDTLIKGAEDDEAKRSQLPGFLADHPGLEHYAGVLRGGTFVLVYDAGNTVVADFMLPYPCSLRRVPPPKPPVLPPFVRPDILYTKPIRMVALPDKFRFQKLSTDIAAQMKTQTDAQVSYLSGLKDMVGVFAGAKTGGAITLGGGSMTTPGMTTLPGDLAQPGSATTSDPVLSLNMADTAWKAQKVDTLRAQLLDPSLSDATRTTLQGQLDSAEAELSAAVVTTTTYVASTGMDVTPGSDGATAMSTASAALGKVSNIDALTDAEKGLTSVGNQTATTTEMKTVIGNMLNVRGIR